MAPRRPLATLLAVLAAGAVAGELACTGSPSATPPAGSRSPTAAPSATAPTIDPSSSAVLEGLSPADAARCASRGGELYQSLRCFSCHEGVAGRALTGLAGRYTLSSLVKYLVEPVPPMPTFRMTDDERRDLAVYLLTAPSTR